MLNIGELPQMCGTALKQGISTGIGNTDFTSSENGGPLPFDEGEIFLSWLRGITPRAILLKAFQPIAITHGQSRIIVPDFWENHLPPFSEKVR